MSTTATQDLVITRTFAAAPQDVFAAVSTPEGVSGWWAPTREIDGELRVTFGTNGHKDFRQDLSEPTRVHWTPMRVDPAPDWVGDTSISFAISPTDDGGSELVFSHHGLGALECAEKCNNAWGYFMESLVEYVDRDGGTPYQQQ